MLSDVNDTPRHADKGNFLAIKKVFRVQILLLSRVELSESGGQRNQEDEGDAHSGIPRQNLTGRCRSQTTFI